jgi:hypothetical protein
VAERRSSSASPLPKPPVSDLYTVILGTVSTAIAYLVGEPTHCNDLASAETPLARHGAAGEAPVEDVQPFQRWPSPFAPCS